MRAEPEYARRDHDSKEIALLPDALLQKLKAFCISPLLLSTNDALFFVPLFNNTMLKIIAHLITHCPHINSIVSNHTIKTSCHSNIH